MSVYAQRLLNVARALRESPAPDMFTMRQFGHGCGTPACAIGHYAARTDLQNGFALMRGLPYFEGRIFDSNDGTFEAARAHFNFDTGDWSELFGSRGCGNAETAIQAAEYIEAFVARKYPAERFPDWNAMASTRTVSDTAVDEMVSQ